MKARFRKEEYTALGDFILPSFERDQAAIVALFPKFNEAFLNAFTTKLAFVKKLEDSIVKRDEQKKVTTSLYEIAAELSDKLTIMNGYMEDAGFTTTIISALKKDLHDHNIEGAILKLEGLEQFVTSNQTELEAEGMPSDFARTLDDYKAKLETKNGLQNQYMNSLKELTEKNSAHYDELYGFISKIAKKGKLVFKGSVIKDEYTIRKTIRRMRAARVKKDESGTL